MNQNIRETPEIPADPTSLLIVTAQSEFLDAALDELKRLDKGLKSIELIAPGIALCTVPDSSALMRLTAEQRPIFVRHLAPVQAIVNLANTEHDIAELALAIASLPTFDMLERGQHFAVQTRIVQPDEKPLSDRTAAAA